MALLTAAISIAIIALASACLALLRLRVVLSPNRPKQSRRRGDAPTHLLIILGSGGHSAEMLSMLERAVDHEDEKMRLNWRDYTFRTWVVGRGDQISAKRAKGFEDMVAQIQQQTSRANGTIKKEGGTGYKVVTVPRARKIHQSLLTAPISSLRCMFACWTALLPSADVDFPDLILCNGPATATILVFVSVLLRFFDARRCNSRGKMRTIYVESWARVKRLSLSGNLLVRVVDRFFVQWPQLLEATQRRGEILGVLV